MSYIQRALNDLKSLLCTHCVVFKNHLLGLRSRSRSRSRSQSGVGCFARSRSRSRNRQNLPTPTDSGQALIPDSKKSPCRLIEHISVHIYVANGWMIVEVGGRQ